MTDPQSPQQHNPPPPPPAAPDPLPAPVAVGDIVKGDPPVPVTLWHLRATTPGIAVSGALARRLSANYAHAGTPVLDLTLAHAEPLPPGQQATLVITTWPRGDDSAAEHLAACAAALAPAGCTAVVLTPTDIPDQLGAIVIAARQAHLTYLQHIVVAHQLTPATRPTNRSRRGAHTDPHGTRRHLRVHTDVLIFARPRHADD